MSSDATASGGPSFGEAMEELEAILRRIEDEEVDIDRLAAELRRAARATLDGIARLAVQLAPERTLERGYSITRTAAGALVRSPDQVAAGDRLATRLAGGTLTSRVEER